MLYTVGRSQCHIVIEESETPPMGSFRPEVHFGTMEPSQMCLATRDDRLLVQQWIDAVVSR